MSFVPTVIIQESLAPRKEAKSQGRPAHHLNDTQSLFTNPWESFSKLSDFKLGTAAAWWQIFKEWNFSHPAPKKEEYVRVEKPDWAATKDRDTWAQDIKATWLGHACFLVELPAPENSYASADIGVPARGPRVLFDPVFSHRCSPSQLVGPGRLTPPPMPLNELPHVDVVVLSHNHYDHTDIATLRHIYASQPKGSVHFFCGLGNLKWFQSIGFDEKHVTELDWWDSRDAKISLQDGVSESILTITCTPAQHFSGRGLFDRMQTLWASWAVEQKPYVLKEASPTAKLISKVWFGGDTGLRKVPFGKKQEDVPVCPAFAQIGERFGGFDLTLVPIGAFSPRAAFSPIHASPADAVEIHLAVKSRRSIGMHWSCWALSDEPLMQDPKRLAQACKDRGVDTELFNTLYVGETLRQVPVKEWH